MKRKIIAITEAALIAYLPNAFIFMDFNAANWSVSGRAVSVGFYLFLVFLIAIYESDKNANTPTK